MKRRTAQTCRLGDLPLAIRASHRPAGCSPFGSIVTTNVLAPENAPHQAKTRSPRSHGRSASHGAGTTVEAGAPHGPPCNQIGGHRRAHVAKSDKGDGASSLIISFKSDRTPNPARPSGAIRRLRCANLRQVLGQPRRCPSAASRSFSITAARMPFSRNHALLQAAPGTSGIPWSRAFIEGEFGRSRAVRLQLQRAGEPQIWCSCDASPSGGAGPSRGPVTPRTRSRAARIPPPDRLERRKCARSTPAADGQGGSGLRAAERSAMMAVTPSSRRPVLPVGPRQRRRAEPEDAVRTRDVDGPPIPGQNRQSPALDAGIPVKPRKRPDMPRQTRQGSQLAADIGEEADTASQAWQSMRALGDDPVRRRAMERPTPPPMVIPSMSSDVGLGKDLERRGSACTRPRKNCRAEGEMLPPGPGRPR